MTGLVLEGGGIRGLYSAGVLDAFMDDNITFDGIIGVSAGACFAPNLISGQRGRALRYNKRFNRDHRYMGFGQLLFTGNYFNTEYCYDVVPKKLDVFDNEAFVRADVPFYAVVTNIITGRPEYMRVTDLFKDMDIIRASASMPFLSTPVKLNEDLYLDGAITDSIPYAHFKKMGYDKLVVILTKDREYIRKPIPKPLCRLVYGRTFPKMCHKLEQRHIKYNLCRQRLFELEKQGKIFVIAPSETIHVSRIERNPDKMQALYDLGIRDYACIKDKMKEFIYGKQNKDLNDLL